MIIISTVNSKIENKNFPGFIKTRSCCISNLALSIFALPIVSSTIGGLIPYGGSRMRSKSYLLT